MNLLFIAAFTIFEDENTGQHKATNNSLPRGTLDYF